MNRKGSKIQSLSDTDGVTTNRQASVQSSFQIKTGSFPTKRVASAQGDGDARSETEELLRLVAARGGGERVANGTASASGRRVRVQGVASSARTPTACGSTSRRPATGGKHTAVIF